MRGPPLGKVAPHLEYGGAGYRLGVQSCPQFSYSKSSLDADA
jgi:hypothetical protein